MRVTTLPLLLAVLACAPVSPPSTTATAPAAAPAAVTLGTSRETAIEVCQPSGERAYLRRLRCPDGAAPAFDRAGSVGPRTPLTKPEHEEMAIQQMTAPIPPGQPDFHTLDLYEVTCGDRVTELFFDMYHCDKPAPEDAPAGFTIEPAAR